MKKLLLIILTSVLVLPVFGQSLSDQIMQKKNKKENQSSLVTYINSKQKEFTAGDYFYKGATSQLIGFGLAASSAVIFSIPSMSNNQMTKEDRTVCYIIGGIASVTAVILEIRGIVLFRKGGKKMQLSEKSREISLHPSSEGIGAKITF